MADLEAIDWIENPGIQAQDLGPQPPQRPQLLTVAEAREIARELPANERAGFWREYFASQRAADEYAAKVALARETTKQKHADAAIAQETTKQLQLQQVQPTGMKYGKPTYSNL